MDEAKILELARQSFSVLSRTYMDKSDLLDFARLVAAAERESCARLASDMVLYTGLDVADAIRSRTE